MGNPSFSWDYADGQVTVSSSYSSDEASASLNVSIKLIEILKAAAAKTENKYDDEVVAFLQSVLEKKA